MTNDRRERLWYRMEAAALIEGLVPPIISHLEIKCAECGTFLIRSITNRSARPADAGTIRRNDLGQELHPERD
jgi:hypothetical protein